MNLYTITYEVEAEYENEALYLIKNGYVEPLTIEVEEPEEEEGE